MENSQVKACLDAVMKAVFFAVKPALFLQVCMAYRMLGAIISESSLSGLFVLFKWRSANPFSTQQLPEQVKAYLLDSGSLTARLIAASDGDFRVQLLQQGIAKPRFEEAKLLGLASHEWALIREVLLYCNGQPWVYARSVVPLSSIKGRLGFLRKLRNAALGALLFKDPALSRSAFEICSIDAKTLNIKSLAADQGTVYGRRSVFHLYKKPILVAEHFLPSCRL